MTQADIQQKIARQNEYIRKLSLKGCAPETWRYAHLELCRLEQELEDLTATRAPSSES